MTLTAVKNSALPLQKINDILKYITIILEYIKMFFFLIAIIFQIVNLTIKECFQKHYKITQTHASY